MIVELTRRMEREFTDLQSRHGRKKSPYCLCEGVRCCSEVLASEARQDIVLAVIGDKLRDVPDFTGIDHAVVSDEKLQTYALSPAVDENDMLYIPIGMKTPDLWVMDLKTKAKKSILTPEERAAFTRHNIKIPSVSLKDGKVYTAMGKQVFLCTPEGLRPAPGVTFHSSWRSNTKMPSCQFRDDGTRAVKFSPEKGVITVICGRPGAWRCRMR